VQVIKDDIAAKKALEMRKKEDFVTEKSFVQNFTTLFIGDLEAKMRFTFNMYDFDDDGYITPEDIRIMLSYMPFNRNVQLQQVQGLIDETGFDSIANSPMSPNRKALNMIRER
jgi:Ca2+-binding EF-hand superfamily protein